ncbi:MAG: PilZ domain-containing protein [Deltaproteobacteria bacterium]|nr:PilZ domain-containing protein [Deltaproteobacteria bacterium]
MRNTLALHAVITKEQFLDCYLKDLPAGGLFLQTEEAFHLGAPIVLKLQMVGLREELEFKGTVAWHRRPRAWSSSLPSGIGFQFHVEDQAKRDFLLKFAAGKVTDRRRSGPRRRAEHDCRVRIHDTWIPAKIANLGAGGVMLMSEEKLEQRTTLPCVVYLDGGDTAAECSVLVERVEKDQSTYVAGARFLRLPQGLRLAFEEMPIVGVQTPETRAQEIIRRSTFPPPRPVTGTFQIPPVKK